LERRLIYEHYYRRLDRQITRHLHAQAITLPGIDVYPIPDNQINSLETRALVQQLSADLLVVHSGPVLDPALFSTPRYGAINVHYGISPDYRGENTLFWAMYQRDYSKLGITIHKIDSNIDSGSILCQGFPALSPEDTEASLCAKTTDIAATALIDVLHHWNPTSVLPVSQRRGLQFNKRDRRVWHDLKLWSRRNLRRELLPSTPERFEFNYCREMVTEPE
jgi:methionyl-tRNA formyltransferase